MSRPTIRCAHCGEPIHGPAARYLQSGRQVSRYIRTADRYVPVHPGPAFGCLIKQRDDERLAQEKRLAERTAALAAMATAEGIDAALKLIASWEAGA